MSSQWTFKRRRQGGYYFGTENLIDVDATSDSSCKSIGVVDRGEIVLKPLQGGNGITLEDQVDSEGRPVVRVKLKDGSDGSIMRTHEYTLATEQSTAKVGVVDTMTRNYNNGTSEVVVYPQTPKIEVLPTLVADKVLKVNNAGDGIEWATVTSAGVGTVPNYNVTNLVYDGSTRMVSLTQASQSNPIVSNALPDYDITHFQYFDGLTGTPPVAGHFLRTTQGTSNQKTAQLPDFITAADLPSNAGEDYSNTDLSLNITNGTPNPNGTENISIERKLVLKQGNTVDTNGVTVPTTVEQVLPNWDINTITFDAGVKKVSVVQGGATGYVHTMPQTVGPDDEVVDLAYDTTTRELVLTQGRALNPDQSTASRFKYDPTDAQANATTGMVSVSAINVQKTAALPAWITAADLPSNIGEDYSNTNLELLVTNPTGDPSGVTNPTGDPLLDLSPTTPSLC